MRRRMSWGAHVRRWLTVAILCGLPGLASAQAPLESEFRTTTATTATGALEWSSVAADQEGRFVVVSFRVPDVSGESMGFGAGDLFFQRYDAAGRPLGAEFQVTLFTDVPVDRHAVAMAGDGRFVIVWELASLSTGIMARRFSAAGEALGAQFRVNTTTLGRQSRPDVAVDGAGNFVVVWSHIEGSDQGVSGQRFDAAGGRLGGEFVVEPPARGPSVAAAPSGAFMVAWSSGYGSNAPPLAARLFDAHGVPTGPVFPLGATTSGFSVDVASDGSGRFVAVWQDYTLPSTVRGRRFDSEGSPLGAAFIINAAGYPSVAVHPDGEFVVAWARRGIYATTFDAAGLPRSPSRLQQWDSEYGYRPRLDVLPGRGFVGTWTSDRSTGNSRLRASARRFGELGPVALALDTIPGPAANGNGVLEAGESVAVAPTWTNATSAPRTATGSIEELTGPGPAALYTVTDASASYGTLPAWGGASCADAGDCYSVGLGAASPRPAAHWDAVLIEGVTAAVSLPPVTWTLHVGDSFTDVPRSSPYYRFVETLLHRGIAGGCAPGLYCPHAPVTREQMAVLALAPREPPWFEPGRFGEFLRCHGMLPAPFDDVAPESPFCPWIEEMAERGVVGGCGPSLYCPSAPVTREEMAVFLLRSIEVFPPDCTTPVFSDVPASSPFCPWIEELARRGITAGCGGGRYCPADPVTREQMAVFVTATFALTLYGP